MTMFITYNTKDTIGSKIEVHVPFSREQLDVPSRFYDRRVEPSMVTEVQADGDALMEILDNIKGLPTAGTTTTVFENDQGYVPGKYFSNLRVMRWYGDMAKFIVGNLFK